MKRCLQLLKLSLLFMLITLLPGLAVGAQENTFTIIPLRSRAYTMTLSPDARLIATSELGVIHEDEVFSNYLPIRLFDSASGQELFALEGHTDYAASLAFNSDGSVLASYHPNGWIYLWNTATGTLIREIPAFPDAGIIHFVPQSSLLLQATTSTTLPGILVWDTDTGAIQSILLERFASRAEARDYAEENSWLSENIVSMLVMPDSETVITATIMNDLLMWNMATNQQRYLLRNEGRRQPNYDIRTLAIAADNETLVYANYRENIVYRQSITDGTATPIYEGTAPVSAVAAASEADVIAWLGGEREAPSISITSIADPTTITEIPLFSEAALPTSLVFIPPTAMLAVSPDGSRIIVGGLYNRDGDENAIVIIEN